MQNQLNASARAAGALISNSRFVVPEFQREYAWRQEQYVEFWNDLLVGLSDESYFLGLVILTTESDHVHVVDGQQRLITISLLAAALRHEALINRRRGLADQIESTFLKVLDYESDEYVERITLSDSQDNKTFQRLINSDESVEWTTAADGDGSLSKRMIEAYLYIRGQLNIYLSEDTFKRLSLWTQFLTDKLYFAVFVHPDPGAAYRVFEVINTRGRGLTPADLIKNYLLSQTLPEDRPMQYARWQSISRQFSDTQSDGFVPFIRHVASLYSGYVLPKNLYDFLSKRRADTGAPAIHELLDRMEAVLPLYLQMIDPTASGPATINQLRVFEAMRELNIAAVRPLLLAVAGADRHDDGMDVALRIVARRAVVGNLGTSGAERRFSDAAKEIWIKKEWVSVFPSVLSPLDASEDDFVEQLRKRSVNKSTLQFIRRSIVQLSTTPEMDGYLHFIRPRNAVAWPGFDEDDVAYWGSTIGNTFLSTSYRRPRDTASWEGVRERLFPTAVAGEWETRLREFKNWDTAATSTIGGELARSAADVWYS